MFFAVNSTFTSEMIHIGTLLEYSDANLTGYAIVLALFLATLALTLLYLFCTRPAHNNETKCSDDASKETAESTPPSTEECIIFDDEN